MSSEKRKDNQEIKKENQSKKIEKINQKITKNILEKDVNQQENHSGKLSFFGKGKNKNSTKKIKNNFSVWNNVEPKYIGIGILIIIILAILAYFLFGRFSPYMDIGYDGYALNDKVTKNLKQNNTDKATQVMDMVKVNDGSTIYKKVASYFVGTPNEKGKSKKEAIDIEYPLYINQNIALYTISKNTKLITNNFEEVKGYQNSTLSDGILYNSSNLSRADSNNYIFIKNSDNIIANLKEAEIKTTANSYKIKINSQINFNKAFINYYELAKVGGGNNESNTDDSNTKTLTTETADKLIFRTIKDIDDNTKVIIDGQELSYPEFLKKLGIDKEKKANSKEVVGNEVDNSTNNSNAENTISNKVENTVENDTENSNTNVEDLSNNQNTNTENNENAEKQEDPNAYKEPEVSVTDFTAEVYTAKGTLTINDPSHALLNGITFMIEKNGKTYQRLLASSSGEVQIQGLEPETRYTIKGTYKFKNAEGKTEEKTFYTGEFTTKDTSSLGNIKLKFENGDIYATKIEVKNIKIENDLNEEVIKGISKLELEIDGLKYRLKQSQIREILQGKEFTYQTSETVKSNSKIKYTFHAYDKAGNELKIESPEGETKTAKQDPKVSISTKKQDITNVVLDLKLTNKDNVELQKYRYVIYDSLDNKVDEGTLKDNQKEIKKDNLDPNKYFKIEIYANYDTDNGKGIQENVLIGKGVFTTLPISSLGYLNLDTSMLELHQEDAKVSIKINTDRTDPRLINILHSFKVTITEDTSYNSGNNGNNKNEISNTTIDGNSVENNTNVDAENSATSIDNPSSEINDLDINEINASNEFGNVENATNNSSNTQSENAQSSNNKQENSQTENNVTTYNTNTTSNSVIVNSENQVVYGKDNTNSKTEPNTKPKNKGWFSEKQTLTKEFTEDELNALKSPDGIELDITPLTSNTKYLIHIEATAKQGSVEENVGVDYDLKEFITLKKSAEVQATNLLVTSSMINFDIRVEDVDQAILNNKIRIELRDQNKDLVDISELETNQDKKEKVYEKLTENQYYTVLFYAEQYNEGSDNSTYKDNYLLKSFTVYTEPGIEGKIQLDNLLRKPESKNLVDVESKVKWYSWVMDNSVKAWGKEYNAEDNSLKLLAGTKGQNQEYVYNLKDYIGQTVTISFEAKKENLSGLWIQNDKNQNTEMSIIYQVKENEYTKFTRTFTVNQTGYVGFLVSAYNNNNNNNNGYAYIKDLQIELGDKATKYEKFKGDLQADMNIYLKDTRDEIETNDYYVRVYKDNKQVSETRYVEFEDENSTGDNNSNNMAVDNKTAENSNGNSTNSEGTSSNILSNTAESSQDTTAELNSSNKTSSNISNSQEKNSYQSTQLNIPYESNNYREINTAKTYQAKENSDYKIELLVKIKGKYYSIGTQEFSTKATKNSKTNGLEIMGIHNEEEYLLIQPEGNYVIINRLDLRRSYGDAYSIMRKYTFFYISFYGTIDFNGKTIKNTFGTYLFDNIASSATLKNIVLDVYFSNNHQNNYWNSTALFSTNYGTVENIYITLKEDSNLPNNWPNILGFYNYGTINKFVVNYEKTLGGTSMFSGLINYNRGIIKNGYIYGQNLYSFVNPDVAVIALQNTSSGIIENIFTLTTIIGNSTTDASGNITGKNSGTVRNVYSYGTGILKWNPNVGVNYGKVENSYYFADKSIPSDTDQFTTKLALKDVNFQKKILNSESAFNINELLNYGYYPQLVFPSCMPNQDFIPLPNIENEDLPDIISSEILENNNNNAKVKITFNNPSGSKISSITLNNIDNSILSQENILPDVEKNTTKYIQTTVIVELKNPVKYLSKYDIMSFSYESSFGITYTQKYNEGERFINVKLFKAVSNIDDWKDIKNSPTENYQLVDDLDFKNENEDDIKIVNLYGYLDGDGHTISNIYTSSPLINNLASGIENLNINNFTVITKSTSSTTKEYLGFIGFMNTGSYAKNLNFGNITIESNISGGNINIGGLVGRTADYKIDISNITINNETIKIDNTINTLTLGGIAGGISYTQIYNSYVQNLNITEYNSINTRGIGGIAGYLQNSSILNTYVTGNISTNAENVGGIVGNSAYSSNIQKSINLLNISSSTDKLGGIVGLDSGSFVRSNLSLGMIYSRLGSATIGPIWGLTTKDTKNSDTFLNNLNYAWDKLAFDNGATIVSSDDLSKKSTYLNLGLDDNFDFSGLNASVASNVNDKIILPKLYNSNLKELLPNQVDNYLLVDEPITIENISATKKDVNHGNVRITLDNPSNFKITSIKIDSMDVTIDKNINSNGKTYLELSLTATKYYDSYRIEEISYQEQESDEIKTIQTFGKINLQFYKDIGKIEDWQAIDSSSAQNYRLINNIDLSTINTPSTNLSIGRLDGNGYKILNFNINPKNPNDINGSNNLTSKFLIKEIKTEIKNISFENIHINSDDQNQYCGIIGINNGNMNNVSFENCSVYTNSSDSALVSQNLSTEVHNINLKDIQITTKRGSSDIGGFIAYTYDDNLSNITAENITIKNNSGQNVGGIFGKIELRNNDENAMNYSTVKNISANNINISTIYSQRVGGIVGEGRTTYSQITNSNISGNTHIGGISGYIQSRLNSSPENLSNNLSTGNKINATNFNAGGLYGYARINISNDYSFYNSITSGGENAGGIVGYSSSINLTNSGVKNSTIISEKNAGGVAGNANNNFINVYVENTKVQTSINAGGLAGLFSNETKEITNIIINADITAKISYSGGLFGYHTHSNVSQYNSKIKHVMLQGSRIASPYGISAMIAGLQYPFKFREPSLDNYEAFYIDAILTNNISGNSSTSNNTTNTSTMYGISGYKDKFYGFRIFSGSSKNDVLPQNDEEINSSDIAKVSDLNDINYFKSLKFYENTGNFNYENYLNGYYPTLSNSLYMDPILRPTDDEIANPNIDKITGNNGNANADMDNINGENDSNNAIDKSAYSQNYDLDLALANYTYNGNTIKVFKNYSLVNDQKMPFIYIVKNGRLSVFDANLNLKINPEVYELNTSATNNLTNSSTNNPANNLANNSINDSTNNINKNILPFQVVVDFYNQNEYQTFLAEDGKLYDLKTTLKYPTDFVNKGISSIQVGATNSTNPESYSDTILTVNYENGAMIKFNYVTGKVLESKEATQKDGLTNYIKSNLFSSSNLYQNLQSNYDFAKSLKEKLENESIEEYLGKQNLNSQNNYLIIYNSDKNDFEVYKESSLLNTNDTESINSENTNSENTYENNLDNNSTNNSTNNFEDNNFEDNNFEETKNSQQNTQENNFKDFQNVQSETSKIEANAGLRAHYLSNIQSQNSGKGWIWIISIITLIVFILIIFKIFFINKKKIINKANYR